MALLSLLVQKPAEIYTHTKGYIVYEQLLLYNE